jgi:hypothetical protein
VTRSPGRRGRYERHHEPLLPRARFLQRVAMHALAAVGLIGFSIGVGMAGYAGFEKLAWVDAFLNASMLLGGMGPVESPQTTAGKVFAGLYALYSGLVFLVAVSIVFAPVIHRVMHRFHLRADQS